MLKTYLNETGRTVYAVAKASGIPYSTLNDLACGKVDINQCRVRLLRELAAALDLSMEEACDICTGQPLVVRTGSGVDATVTVRHKSYYAQFCYQGEPVEMELCRISEDSSFYIEEIAAWRTEGYIRRRRMQEFR